jgi:hypothetical protein
MGGRGGVALGFLLAASGASPSSADAVVTFESGAQGWVGPSGPGGTTFIDTTGGNPGRNLRTIFSDFGITFHNSTNPAFVGDYGATPTVTLAIDVKVESIDFFGSPVPRPWLVDLRDYDDPWPGYPYKSVWYKFADISAAANSVWTTYTVAIADTASTTMPPGWGGTGYEDPETFEPTLPPGTTFADVLAGVDEIALTTFEPGWFFGETAFDVRIDNVSIFTAPPPVPGVSGALLLAKSPTPGMLVLSWGASCGTNVVNYGIYEGEIGSFDGHTRIDCLDGGGDRTESVTPGSGDRYFLVVPLGIGAEGSYGTDSLGDERSRGAVTCRAVQDTGSCF